MFCHTKCDEENDAHFTFWYKYLNAKRHFLHICKMPTALTKQEFLTPQEWCLARHKGAEPTVERSWFGFIQSYIFSAAAWKWGHTERQTSASLKFYLCASSPTPTYSPNLYICLAPKAVSMADLFSCFFHQCIISKESMQILLFKTSLCWLRYHTHMN